MNPLFTACLEQTLESYELCCLVETFPQKHVDLEDFKRTLKVRRLAMVILMQIAYLMCWKGGCSSRIYTPRR